MIKTSASRGIIYGTFFLGLLNQKAKLRFACYCARADKSVRAPSKLCKVINLVEIKERYLQDSVPIRLGGLAANLARVKSFSRNIENQSAVFDLFEESKHFIEWTATETKLEITVELIELQLQIAVWQRQWQKIWNNEESRKSVAATSADWSKKLLEKSGILNK